MTATLNARACSEVRLTIPRYGVASGWATLTDADAVPEGAGALSLSVAGLAMRCTFVRQADRAGLRTVELVGGYGGWDRAVRPQGFAAGNLVWLSAYVSDLAESAGERIVLAPGIDRKIGEVAARLGGDTAGAMLTQACALPAGAEVIPWWVDLDGTTRLGPRTGAATTYQSVDADDLMRRIAFSEDNAAPLLPGCTFAGSTIEELRIEADGEGARETITVAANGEAPRTLHAVLRRLIQDTVGPWVSAARIYRYRVHEVLSDGRIEVVPVRSLLAPDLRLLRVWPGIAGGRCRPREGSMLLVQFADGDPCASAACVVGFQPAIIGSNGIPLQAELDADQIVLARGTHPTGRGGATFGVAIASAPAAGALQLTVTNPVGVSRTWTITGTNGGGAVVFATTPSTFTIDAGRPEVLV